MNAVDVFGDRDGVRLYERDGRRVSGQSGADQLAFLIAQRDTRAKQVRVLPVGSAAKIDRMAAGTIGPVERLAADEHILRRQRPCELRIAAGTPASALAPSFRRGAALSGISAAASCGRWRSLPDWRLALRRRSSGALREDETSGDDAGKCDGGDAACINSHEIP